jgi:hypothetical protein
LSFFLILPHQKKNPGSATAVSPRKLIRGNKSKIKNQLNQKQSTNKKLFHENFLEKSRKFNKLSKNQFRKNFRESFFRLNQRKTHPKTFFEIFFAKILFVMLSQNYFSEKIFSSDICSKNFSKNVFV